MSVKVFIATGALLVSASTLVRAQTQAAPPMSNLSYYNPDLSKPAVPNLQCDVCIYGGTSAGVAAALQVSRDGKRAIILEPSNHLGGVSAGGLGETDIGNKAAIGGISHEFYQRIGQKYGASEEWKFEPHVAAQVFSDMVAESKTPVYYRQFLKSVQKDGARITSITMENGLTVSAPMFIDATYEGDLMAKAGVSSVVGREANTVYGETLDGVQVHNLHQFDLPVDPYVVEGNTASGLLPGVNGTEPGPTGTGDSKIQAYCFRLCLTNDPANRIPFEKPAGYDPNQYILLSRYLKAGWPESEVFRKFDPIRNSFSTTADAQGTALTLGDLSDAKSLLVKFKKQGGPFTRYLMGRFSPGLQNAINGYDGNQTPSPQLQQQFLDALNGLIRGPLLYTPELFAQVKISENTRQQITQNLSGGALMRLNQRLLREAYPNELGLKQYQKVDKNNHGAISTDFIGGNYDYPEADYATREKIFQAHVTYQKGLMWFMGNDPSVPEKIRARWSQWGLCKDEFQETGGWPHQLYVREARRMKGAYIMTERNCRGQEVVPDPIGLAAYTMDSHNVQRFVKDGRVWNEGDVQEKGILPYPISYRAILPQKAQCTNLLVPVCLSASHIAYGSIRMEPVFMILGQSAAEAANLAIDRKVALQDVFYPDLKAKLRADKQVLAWGSTDTMPVAGIGTDPQAALRAFFGHLKDGAHQTVVVYGTSLTAGGSWTSQLKQWFDQQYPNQVTFINSGLSGKNSDEGVAQMQEKLLDHKPDLVFVEFAINDAHVKFNMPVERGKSNLDTIVKAVRAQNPNAAIVLQVMDIPWDAPNGNRSLSDRPQLSAFNDNYRTYAHEQALPIIDHNPDWIRLRDTNPDQYHSYLPDGLHPNNEGNKTVTWPPIEALMIAARDAPTH